MVKSKWILAVLLAIAICAGAPKIHAASGTWVNGNGGSWTNIANWSGGIIADGSGNRGNFGTLTLSANATVTLDAARTIGSLIFDDQNSTKHGWFLNSGNAGSLTLSATTPTITVNSATTVIAASLLGSSGLTKAGAGKLVLSGANSYTGNTTINAGTLSLGTVTFSATASLNIASPGAVAESSGTLSLAVNTTGTAIDVSGTGTLRLTSSTNGTSSPDLYFGPNHSSNSDWSARLATSLDLGSTQRFIFGKTGHNGVGPYGLTGADCQFAGTISGTGGLTFIAQNNWTGTGPMEVPFALNGANTFTGPVEIQRGSVYLGNANALTHTNSLTFNAGAGNNARLFLYGNNAIIGNLSSPGSGTALIANGNLKSGATLTLGAVNLSINQTQDATFSGVITDAYPEYTGSGSGTTGPLNLIKNGTGSLRLAGANNYSGTTSANAGTLEIAGSIGPGSVLIKTGATLSGGGIIAGPTQVQPGGTLAPGTGGLGTLTIDNTLSLAGNVVMEISKNGSTLLSDQVSGTTTLTYGGTLTATNIGGGIVAAGNSFTLFNATNYTGSFASLVLPALSAGLIWDSSNLTVNGTITVAGTAAAPVITSQPQGLTVDVGNAAAFNVVAAGPRPIAYQWLKNGGLLAPSTGTRLVLGSVTTNDAAEYSAVVTNLYGSTTSSVAVLTVRTGALATTVTNGLVAYLNFDNNISAQAGTTNGGSLYLGGAT